MKYLILILTIVAFTSIIIGYTVNLEYSEKLIGFGVTGLFLVVFPLFSYHRWKGKNAQDYMLTKENLDKMREREGDKRK